MDSLISADLEYLFMDWGEAATLTAICENSLAPYDTPDAIFQATFPIC